MGRQFLLYGVALLVFAVLDFIWLRVIAKDFYFTALADTLRARPILWAAAVFYLVYPAGLVIFGILKSGDPASVRAVFVSGALFGFFAYLTYDATSYAIAKNFPLKVALVDVLWGSLASGAACAASVWLLARLR